MANKCNPEKLQCPYCSKTNTAVIGSVVDNDRVIRERKCLDCGNEFYTEEIAQKFSYGLRYAYHRARNAKKKTRNGGSR